MAAGESVIEPVVEREGEGVVEDVRVKGRVVATAEMVKVVVLERVAG